VAFPGPNTALMDIVGREAFLEALGDPELRVRILDKTPTTMDEALRIALNLEALHKSKETQRRAMESHDELSDEELHGIKGKLSRLAVKSVDAADKQRTPVLVDVTQLREVLTSCMQEAVVKLQKEFAAMNQVREFNCNAIRMSSGETQRSTHQKRSNESMTQVAGASGPANRSRSPSNMTTTGNRRQFNDSSRRRRNAAHGLDVLVECR